LLEIAFTSFTAGQIVWKSAFTKRSLCLHASFTLLLSASGSGIAYLSAFVLSV
jgi:hypothetical protein